MYDKERARAATATQFLQRLGIDCTIDSIRWETVTVLCGSGVMAYYDQKLLMMGEHIPLPESPISVFVNDAVRHVHAEVTI